MADKRRGKQKRKQDLESKPTKDEYAVAKFLRFNVPTREGKLVGMPVQCFIASKAVDALLESKWASGKNKSSINLTTRGSALELMNRLLSKGLFHRAARIESKKEKKKKKALKESEVEESGKEEDKQKRKERRKKQREIKRKEEEGKKDDDKDTETERDERKDEEKEKKEEEKKSKRKLKLEMHDYQVFMDGNEVYVWIYDPVSTKTFIIGLLLVLGSIAVCLFPLWPPEVRQGVYYLSLASAGFVSIILMLCVVRGILFCLVWCVTLGNHHFWFLPNLTEDVGFFDSFRPLYQHSVCSKEPTKKLTEGSTSATGDAEVSPSTEQVKKEEEELKEEEGKESGSENSYEIVNAEDGMEEEGVEEDKEAMNPEEEEGSAADDGDDESEDSNDEDNQELTESKKDR